MINNENRARILKFLQWNDRHGCYTDENCELENASKLTYDDAVKFFFGVMNEDFYYSKVDNIFELSYEEVINYARENGFYESTMNKLNQLLESDRPDEDLYNELICSLASRVDSDSILLDVDLHNLTEKIAYISDIGNSFSNLLKPHLESYANLSARISKTFDSLVQLSNSANESLSESLNRISESLNLLASSVEKIGSLSWGIDFNYEQFTDNQKSLAQRMVRNGWYFTGNLPPTNKELLSINDKEFNLALCDFYDSESEYMFNRILETFPHRKHILAKIEKAHNNKDYELCIPTMLSQADGISYELFNVSLFSKDKFKQPKTKNQKQIKFDEDSIMDILFVTQLSLTGNLNQDVFTKPKFFNRHSVIHGTDVHYNKKQNSLRCLSMLYFLAEVKDRKEELSRIN